MQKGKSEFFEMEGVRKIPSLELMSRWSLSAGVYGIY
jgi:hypothetical protein